MNTNPTLNKTPREKEVDRIETKLAMLEVAEICLRVYRKTGNQEFKKLYEVAKKCALSWS